MAYEALARKYRPRSFEEVVGQEPIVKTLGNALREKRIHHAYVFSGVRGVGKTTIARIFAKALNCEKGPTPTPCLACDPCVEIAAGRDMDVIEMDAASRTGVDDVRDLIDTTRYAPARDRYKVFIIDEFHMLSKPAFNALLKTLEEPPPRVVFLMATTELHKVLPTVLSRTQQFDFRKVGVQEIADQLAMIAKKEKVEAPRAALEMLARAGDGSVRDAESLLDQAIAFCGSKLGEADVRTLLGLVPEETVEAFLGGVADKDAGALVRTIASVLAEGHDLRLFHAGLIEGVRRLLVHRSVADPSEILGLSAEEEGRLAALAERFTTDALLRVFSVLSALEAPLKYSDQPRYQLEAAAIRLAAIAELAPIEDLIARLEGDGPRTSPPSRPATSSPPVRAAAPGTGPSRSPAAPPGRPPGRKTRSENPADPVDSGANGDTDGTRTAAAPSKEGASRTVSAPLDEEPPPPSDEDAPADTTTAGPSEPAGGPDLRATEFTARLYEKKESLAMLVGHAAGITLEGRRVVIHFDDTQAFLRKSAEQAANAAILRETAKAVLGDKATVEIRRAEPGALPATPPDRLPPRDMQPAATSTPDETFGTASGYAPSAGGGDGDRESADEPLLDGLSEELPGTSAPGASAPAASTTAAASGSRTEVHVERAADAPRTAPPAGPGSSPGLTGARYQRLQAQALEDPVVRSLVSRFGGRIVDIKEVP